jgi:hypothetical protein
MLTTYRRHKLSCPQRHKGRAYRRCACPFWVDGTFNGDEIRQSLRVHTCEDAENELERLKRRLTQPQGRDEPVTLGHAWDEFVRDAEAVACVSRRSTSTNTSALTWNASQPAKGCASFLS